MMPMHMIVKIKGIPINKIAINILCILKVQNTVYVKSIQPIQG